MKYRSQHGVALVITLIMLSVITVMAVAFLALTRREKAQVYQSTHLLGSQQMSDAGLERAKAHIIASILNDLVPNTNGVNTNNVVGPNFIVSGNFMGSTGFVANSSDATNVNYDSYAGGGGGSPLNNPNLDDFRQILTNLFYDPRPPVFVNTNRGAAPPDFRQWDFRFFLDLNRNGFFEQTGLVPLTNSLGQPILDNNGMLLRAYLKGDPQWIGVLERPHLPHSAANKFVGRYCFVVLPVGQTLDINFIHNQAKYVQDMNQGNCGFFRNQGFGCWEINLAAFLTDLNANLWNPVPPLGFPYSYNPDPNPSVTSSGTAFLDAMELLRFRYTPFGIPSPSPQSPHTYLDSASMMFANLGMNFTSDFIDDYADGLLDNAGRDLDNPARPWSGANSKQHFFAVHDLFAPSKFSAPHTNFMNRLARASAGISTEDRYTYYNLLSLLGTDSAPEPANKINLNYDNQVQRNPSGVASATNFYSWQPTNFFMTVADRLLRKELTNQFARVANIWTPTAGILVFSNSFRYLDTNTVPAVNRPFYSPRIHQLLQVAANICDATMGSKAGEGYPYLPSVFRPVFTVTGNEVRITGYTEETSSAFILRKWVDLENPNDRAFAGDTNFNVFGVPLIVGARKGYPNFNEFVLQTEVGVTRKLEFRKNPVNSVRPTETNQQFIIAVSNVFGIEAWNSYASTFPRQLEMIFANVNTSVLTNDAGLPPLVSTTPTYYTTSFNPGTPSEWRGTRLRATPDTNGYRISPLVTQIVLTNSVYYQTPPHFELVGSNAFEKIQRAFTNRWGLNVTNRFLFFLVDRQYDRVVDAVNLGSVGTFFDISEELDKPTDDTGTTLANVWRTNPSGNVTEGIMNQIAISRGEVDVGADWLNYSLNPVSGRDRENAIETFKAFLDGNLNPRPGLQVLGDAYQAPFTPSRKMYQTTVLQVNDPLVHYTLDDLRDTLTNAPVITVKGPPASIVDITHPNARLLGQENKRYVPWAKGSFFGGTPHANEMSPAVRDPGVTSSDKWDFPTNKFPNIGWLGRVHRGTPWQTLYLKSAMTSLDEWASHTRAAYSPETHPTNDWHLLDHFTVAQHPNASRGQLSANQTNLPAWSAVLSGVEVSTVVDDGGGGVLLTNEIIQPAAVFNDPVRGNPLMKIVEAINQQRNKRPGNRFSSLGEILATPELSVASPFLTEPFISSAAFQAINFQDPNSAGSSPLKDSDYERIPERILSLLRLGDTRFVVYAWGQSLQPARVVTSGDFRGLVENYQITGEVATRAVVRIDFEPHTDANDVNYGKPDFTKPRAVVESFNIMPPE